MPEKTPVDDQGRIKTPAPLRTRALTSRAAAVKQFCIDCMGGSRADVRDCTARFSTGRRRTSEARTAETLAKMQTIPRNVSPEGKGQDELQLAPGLGLHLSAKTGEGHLEATGLQKHGQARSPYPAKTVRFIPTGRTAHDPRRPLRPVPRCRSRLRLRDARA